MLIQLLCGAVLTAAPFLLFVSDDAPASGVVAPHESALVNIVTHADLLGHYDAVLEELRAADTSHLDAEGRDARVAAIASLAAYRAAGDFGRSSTDPSARGFLFVDGDGRRCAVAHVLDAFGEEDLVLGIAGGRNSACISQLVDEPGLADAWARTGLSLAEAARIQGPNMGNPTNWGARPAPPATPGDSAPPGAGRSASGTGGGAAARGAASTGQGGSAGEAAGTLRGASARTGDRATSARTQSARTASSTGTDEAPFVMEDWWTWWEMNKLRFMRPHRLDMDAREDRGERYGERRAPATADIHALRERVVSTLRTALDDEGPEIRGRAAVALGRLGGAAAVPHLLPLLEDGSRVVRESAVLGLGATRSASAVSVLLNLAAGDAAGLGPDGRQLALLSLALARRGGYSDSLDGLVSAWITSLPTGARSDMADGALLYQLLVHDDELAVWARDLVQDGDADSRTRGLAAAAMRRVSEPGLDVPMLTLALGDVDLELRRAAALSLGRIPHDLVAGPLATAFEVEHDPRTRGALLIGLGERGGIPARDMLLAALDGANRDVRAFAAFGTALYARRTGDVRARAALRDALGSSRNRDLRGALVLSCGIAGDVDATDALARILERDREGRVRSFAALSLGMLGAGSAEVLRAQIAVETDAIARVGLVQALGMLGDASDTAALLTALREVDDPALRGLVAVGLAFHGSRPAAAGLLEVVDDGDVSDASRASAIEALGLMLDAQPGLQLAEVTSSANTDNFPDWLLRAVSTFTL